MVEGRRLDPLPGFIIKQIEERLGMMQNEKFPFTRGPDGMYTAIKRKLKQEEQEKKAMRKQLFSEQQTMPSELGLSTSPRIVLPSSHEQIPLLLSASPLFVKSPAVRKISSSSVYTMVDRPPLPSRVSEDIFEMEMDSVEPIESPAKRFNERFDSQETLVDLDTKPVTETRKQKSILDIMHEEQVKKDLSNQSLRQTKSPGHSSISLLSSSFSNIRIKSDLSQKARKKSMSVSQLAPLTISPKGNPWGSLGSATSPSSSRSFRDIQEEEERAASRIEQKSLRPTTPKSQLST
jgi:hypothetical protein